MHLIVELKKILFVLLLVSLMLILSYFAVFPSTGHFLELSPRPSVIQVGSILPLTGISSDGGEYARRGLLIAQEQIQNDSSKKYKVHMNFEDSQFKSDVAITAFQKLHSINGVQFIIGDFGSGQTLALAPIAEANKVILITPGSQADSISSSGEYVFRTEISARQEVKFFAPWFYKNFYYKKIVILSCIHEYCDSFKNNFLSEFQKAIQSDIRVYSYNLSQTDFRDILLKSKNDAPEVILILGNPQSAAIIMKQANELGLKVQFVGTSPLQRNTLIGLGGSSVDGLLYTYSFDDSSSDSQMRLYQKLYHGKYNESSEAISANAYDALMLLSNCFEQVGLDTTLVKSCLYSINDYHGASGTFSIDANGDAVGKQFVVKIVVGGRFIVLPQ